MKTWIKVLLTVIITVSVVGYVTYYLANKKATTDKKNLQSQVDDLNSKIAKLNQQIGVAKVSATVTTDDDTALLKICQAGFPGFSCAVSRRDGNYATGTASDSAEGVNWYARKTSNTWTLIGTDSYGFQDFPLCLEVSDFPKTIVPECGQ